MISPVITSRAITNAVKVLLSGTDPSFASSGIAKDSQAMVRISSSDSTRSYVPASRATTGAKASMYGSWVRK